MKASNTNSKKYTKELFAVEVIIGLAATVLVIAMVAIAAIIIEKNPVIGTSLIVIPVVSYIIICLGLTKMEQVVGHYQCSKCRHKHVPKYNAVLWSMHFGRTRYMTCPKCHKKTWQKKTI